MRTFVATYKIYDFIGEEHKQLHKIEVNKLIKYKFVEEAEHLICYVTIIGKNRLHIRTLKRKALKNLKRLGKVELVVSVG